jgi:hypothetical protein
VVTLTSTTFTSIMTICVVVTSWTSTIIIDFPWNIFCILANFGQFVILWPFKPQMWHAYEDVFCDFWFCYVAFVIAIMVCSFFFLHVFTLWFVIPQFVQCLLVFLILFCVFVSIAYLIHYGIDNAFLTFVVVIPSSHNIIASLCCSNVNHFIPAIAILRYDYKHVLNTIVKKLFVVATCKPWTNFWICL